MRALGPGLAIAFAFAIALARPHAPAVAAQTYPLAVARSKATFAVTHLYVSRVTGSIPIVAGTVAFADGDVPSAVEATLDARRIATDDRDRDDDLQGPDWFDTKAFPLWTFRSDAIAPAPGGFTMHGTLAVHGVPQAVVLNVTIVRGLPHAAYHATGTLDRHGFGMHRTPMDGLIGGTIDLALDVELP